MGTSVEVELLSLAFGGSAVGRLASGKVIFADGGAPGDLARVEITKDKKTFARGFVRKLKRSSPDRVRPVCGVADTCGGCDWMHLSYECQLSWKRQLLEAELARAELMDEIDVQVFHGAKLKSRSRARLHLRPGGKRLGTLAARSHRVVPLRACAVMRPELEAFALETADALEDLCPPSALAEVELSVDSEGGRGLYIDGDPGITKKVITEIASGLGVAALGIGARAGRGEPLREGSLVEACGDTGLVLTLSSGVFSQANREINAVLVDEVLKGAGQGRRFVELYAGSGNLTLPLSTRFEGGLATESEVTAAEDLERNLAVAAPWVEGRHEDAADTMERLAFEGDSVDTLVLDPPRAGAREALESLAEHARPERIVMVSCHPMAAIRDAKTLCHDHGYRVTRVAALDMFPQTSHLELVMSFTLEG